MHIFYNLSCAHLISIELVKNMNQVLAIKRLKMVSHSKV